MAAAKKVVRRLKIELDAGNAGPAELGKMLGPFGLNLREIMLRYNEATGGAARRSGTGRDHRARGPHLCDADPPTADKLPAAPGGRGRVRLRHAVPGRTGQEHRGAAARDRRAQAARA